MGSKTVDATMFRLQQMIEHIKELSTDFKEKHPEIPWIDIIGFRNRIVHDYGKNWLHNCLRNNHDKYLSIKRSIWRFHIIAKSEYVQLSDYN